MLVDRYCTLAGKRVERGLGATTAASQAFGWTQNTTSGVSV